MENMTIETLRLASCQSVDSNVWKYLCLLDELRRIDVSNTGINDDNIEELERMKKLEEVIAVHTDISQKFIDALICKCNLIHFIDARTASDS